MEPHIIISSLVRPYENIEKVIQSINVFFPDFKTDEKIENTSFPTKNKNLIISGKSESLNLLLKQIRIQRISDTALDIMSVEANLPLRRPDIHIGAEEKKEYFDKTIGSGRFYFYKHFGSNSVDNIVSRVRYMAKALDCQYIVLDHVSMIVSSQEYGDERKALDEIMTKLRVLVEETDISLIIVSHLRRPDGKGHEEGAATSLSQLRGSASIGQLSDMVIGLERDAQHDDVHVRNTTCVRVLKNRFVGMTGPATYLYYDKDTGRLTETEKPNGNELDEL